MSKLKKLMSAVAVTSALSLVFTASVDAKQYTVKKGDTLYSIAKRNNTTVAKVVSDNRIVNGIIKPGQVLNVASVAPAPVPAATTKVAATTKAPAKVATQTVVSGQHKIVKGDTLYSIARKNGMTLAELKKLNNLSSNYVPVGRVLNVTKPATAPKTTVAATTKKAVVTTKTPVTTEVPVTTKVPTTVKVNANTVKGQHKVVKGDTLYNIAKRNGMTVDELKKLNNLTSNNVSLGRVLTVNKPATSVPTPVGVTTTAKATTTAQATTKKETTKPEVTTTTAKATTKKEVAKPAEVTTTVKATTKKVANVPGATFKNQADQELWNKVANNYKNDPTVGGLKPRVAQMKQFLGSKFDVKDFSVYRPGDYDGTGHGHGDGLALDLMVPVGGKKGDDISNYLVDNYKGLGIYYLIWEQKFYMDQNNIYGPANKWNWMPDRGSITANHYDHVHISFKK